jgi:hypothetical protein
MGNSESKTSEIERLLSDWSQEPIDPTVERQLGDVISAPLPSRVRATGTRRAARFWFSATAAAMILLAVGVIWLLPRPQSAWAQVVSAVKARPWMRLTLQKPSEGEPAAKEFSEAVLWFRGDGTVAASQWANLSAWLDLVENEAWTFDSKRGVVRRGRNEPGNDSQYEDMLCLRMLSVLLRRFEIGDAGNVPARLTLVETQEDEVVLDGQRWSQFSFAFKMDSSCPDRLTLVLQVDPKTRCPVRMDVLDEGGPPMHFTIDYPENGPDDIYALGAPASTAIVDTLDLERYFEPRDLPEPTDFQATVLLCLPSKPLAWIIDATRYRSEGGTTNAAYADADQVYQLANRVYYEDYGPNKTPAASWWADEVAKLDFEPPNETTNGPHRMCYCSYGRPEDYDSVTVADDSIEGLEGMILLRGPEMCVWLDPQRDMIVRRMDSLSHEDGAIHATQVDEVERGPNGNWFAIQWRGGRVEELGDPLKEHGPGDVASTLSIAVVKFVEE